MSGCRGEELRGLTGGGEQGRGVVLLRREDVTPGCHMEPSRDLSWQPTPLPTDFLGAENPVDK